VSRGADPGDPAVAGGVSDASARHRPTTTSRTPATSTTTFDDTAAAGTATRRDTRELLGRVMGLVAVTVAFSALGAYLGRDLEWRSRGAGAARRGVRRHPRARLCGGEGPRATGDRPGCAARAGEAGDLVGGAVLDVAGALLGVLGERGADRPRQLGRDDEPAQRQAVVGRAGGCLVHGATVGGAAGSP
jgi:hypothetical protein